MQDFATTRQFGVWSVDSEEWAGGPWPVTLHGDREYSAVLEVARAVVAVQQAVGTRLMLPLTMSAKEHQTLIEARQLMGGGTAKLRATDPWLTVDTKNVKEAADIGPGALRVLQPHFVLSLGPQKVDMGPVVLQLFGTTSSPADKGGSRVAVEVEVDTTVPVQVRLATVDDVVGRWVAQNENHIVAVGDSPADVISILKNTNRSGGIWRVPSSRAGAEATVFI